MSIGNLWAVFIFFLLGALSNAQVTNSTRQGIWGEGVLGESGNNVVLINSTGLKIIRVLISDKTYEDIENKQDKILVNVSPKIHHLELVFRGGARIDWPRFNFRGVREIVFTLSGNHVVANPK